MGLLQSCTCPQCASACARIPGIMTPLEALKAIRAGLADDLMARWDTNYDSDRSWVRCGNPWRVLMPRSVLSREVERSMIDLGLPLPPKHHRTDAYACTGRCVFFTRDSLCSIHDSGFKPAECRATLTCKRETADRQHDNTKAAWASWVGQAVVKIWQRELEKPRA